jgi:CubicO group peptidase (beta-lactamase class C family)
MHPRRESAQIRGAIAGVATGDVLADESTVTRTCRQRHDSGHGLHKNGRVFVTDEDRAKIVRIAEAMFTQQCALGRVPRMAGAVSLAGEVVAFFGNNATPDTLFRIASMTKSFTAAATLLLRDEGHVQLDVPVSNYVPEFATLTGPTSDAPALTLRHFLTMSSGLATDDPWGDRHLDITEADLNAVVEGGPIFGQHPLTAFEYSNLGYGIIGRVIQRVSGLTPQSFIATRLLKPLGMNSTVWEARQADDGSGIALGVRTDEITQERILLDGGLATMGGLWSTASDLAKWMAFFTDAYPPRDDAETYPLRRSSRREMQNMYTYYEPASHLSPDGAPIVRNGGYGMGLFIDHDPVLGEVAGHSGGLPGYGSNMRWVKGLPIGVVALGNITYAPMANTTRRVLDALSAAKVVTRASLAADPTLESAGRALLSLLTNWSDQTANTLFADNVEPDEPFAERKQKAEALVARHGNLTFARVETRSRAAGRLIALSPTGEVTIGFSLAPLAAGTIQRYDLPH